MILKKKTKDSKLSSAKNTKQNDTNLKKDEKSLVHSDYQLHQALIVLKGMSTLARNYAKKH